MKASFLIPILLIIPSLLISQTIELEKEHLNNVIQSGKLGQAQLKKMGISWRELLNEFGGYPELPYNPVSQRIEYTRIDSFNGLTKKDIYPKVKEWIAINYGSIKAVLHYEDFDSGKIIVKGHNFLIVEDILKSFWGSGSSKNVVRSLKCYHTTIFTIKDGKMKTEFTNLEYESTTNGYFTGTYYVPATESKYSIIELYPVTIREESTWVSRLSTLKNTSTQVNYIQESIKRYINDSKKDLEF
tara:strand:- start:738 stop:1466 length:729 start_codon:yes stop_codon:yes gene_type:complete